MSAVAPKSQPPKPKNTKQESSNGILTNIIKKIKSLFSSKEKRTSRFRTNNRKRYSRSYNPKYNKYKPYNKRKNNTRKSNNKSHN